MKPISLIAVVLLLAAAPEAGAGSDSKSMARSFGRAAKRAAAGRVAVLPFEPLDDSRRSQGRLAAEELTTWLSRAGGVQVVERSMLGAVMREQALGLSGAIDASKALRLGRLLQADAVVVGAFVTIGNTVELNARLIRVETGVVLAARRAQLKGKGVADYSVIPKAEPIRAMDAAADVLAFQKGYDLSERGAPLRREAAGRRSEPELPRSCDGARARVDGLLEGILELKARHWANQALRRGLTGVQLGAPGRTIPNPEMRERFYALVAAGVARRAAPLDPIEMKRFITADREAFLTGLECGLAKRPEADAEATRVASRFVRRGRE